MMQNKGKNRIIAIIMIVAVVSVMLFSTVYLEEQVNHDCTGEDCPICAMMIQCSNNLKQIGGVVAVVVCVASFGCACESLQKYSVNLVSFHSLISQKVRLND